MHRLRVDPQNHRPPATGADRASRLDLCAQVHVRAAAGDRLQKGGRLAMRDGRYFDFAAVPLPDGNALFARLGETRATVEADVEIIARLELMGAPVPDPGD